LQRFLKYGTALAAKTESDFNSVERVVQYLEPETEAAEETDPELAAKLPKDWPSSEYCCQGVVALLFRGQSCW
jgi:ATP-binding cassette subfamily C (CFTR/MRP) protein 1